MKIAPLIDSFALEIYLNSFGKQEGNIKYKKQQTKKINKYVNRLSFQNRNHNINTIKIKWKKFKFQIQINFIKCNVFGLLIKCNNLSFFSIKTIQQSTILITSVYLLFNYISIFTYLITSAYLLNNISALFFWYNNICY